MPACCKHLRTKKMFIPVPAATELREREQPSEGTSPCWCNRTLTETGPDDRPVNPDICRLDRECFEE
jgi:hypothetical protein